jgi:hypothetical protein
MAHVAWSVIRSSTHLTKPTTRLTRGGDMPFSAAVESPRVTRHEIAPLECFSDPCSTCSWSSALRPWSVLWSTSSTVHERHQDEGHRTKNGPKTKAHGRRTYFHMETKTALNPEQARALLAAVRDHRLGALFTLAKALGLRRGEALGLKWDAVDLDSGTLTVRAVGQTWWTPGDRT